MKILLTSLSSCYRALGQRNARAKLRGQLLRENPQVLADIGISREQLLYGIRSWPWHQPEEDHQGYRWIASRQSTIASDAELADLGIARPGIEQAVKHGRPGMPEDEQRDLA